MSALDRDKIIEDLKKVKEEGQSRYQRIREIVRLAVSQATDEVKEGSGEISGVAQDAIATVADFFKDKSGEIKEDVTASVEGAIAAVDQKRRQSINATQAEMKQLQGKIEAEEAEMTQEVDQVLNDIEQTSQSQSEKVQEALQAAVAQLKDTEEAALMRKRYAQLQAQLAVVQANLASRYGERYEDIKHYLDDAKTWYERAKAEPEVFTEKVKARQQEFEGKLSTAGTAIARKEKEVKGLLSDLWKTLNDIFREDKDSNNHS
jgi:metal-responsive CopG/Arc/MetJ family transcriptional regulator